MNPILPSELPYVIGFIALVVLIFWLIGRAADSGALERQLHPAWTIGCVIIWFACAIGAAAEHKWLGMAIYAAGALVFAFDGWRRWQRS